MIFPSTIVVKTFKHFGKILGGGWGKRRQAVSVKVRFIFCALPQSDEKGVWLTTKALPMIPPLQYIPTSQPTLTHSWAPPPSLFAVCSWVHFFILTHTVNNCGVGFWRGEILAAKKMKQEVKIRIDYIWIIYMNIYVNKSWKEFPGAKNEKGKKRKSNLQVKLNHILMETKPPCWIHYEWLI